jgi:malonyl-CoA/methylmalonyl-CoA synthetase
VPASDNLAVPQHALTTDDPVVPRTLPAAWAARWRGEPRAPVLCFADDELTSATTGSAWMRASELDERTTAVAAELARRGVRPGDRVVWHAEAEARSLCAALATLRLGAVLVPVNPALTARELEHVAKDAEPVLSLADGHRGTSGLLGLPGLPGLPSLDSDPPTAGRGAASVEAQRTAGPGDPGFVLDGSSPSDPALIVYTSGTTGAPKGAVLTHGNLAAGSAALRAAWRWCAEDRLSLSLPLFHVHGLCAGLFTALDAGASVVLRRRFDAGVVLDDIERHGESLFFGVPTMYYRLVARTEAGRLSRLRLCVSGSAALAATLWHEVAGTAGVAVLERYGMTETLLTVSNPYEGERRPGTVGLPLPGVAIHLSEGPGPDAAGSSTSGELWVRGPSVFAGYWRRPAASAECMDSGWFKTGDVASFDESGYLVLHGRTNELIISGGHNVYPVEVEDVLLTHPGVREVAVAGAPSREWGEVVAAFVVAGDDALHTEDLLEWAAARLAPYKCPREVRFVDSLPRNAMGKVQRGRLEKS